MKTQFNLIASTLCCAVASVVVAGLVRAAPAPGSSLDSETAADAKDETPPTGGVRKPHDASKPANRLARESSPYLLLHAHNPVDWYPWGPEAFEKAKSENKPIFLSIGYSSCYWCHVMERQVFSNAKIAEFMNEHFVNIKVDREERPDVDEIYMTSLIVYQQAAGIGGGGGWPLSLFLTPDGNPIAGATYLPPEDTPDGRTGFLTAAGRIHELWTADDQPLRKSAAMLATEVRRLSGPGLMIEPVELNRSLIDAAITDIRGHYDPVHGGVDFRPQRPDSPRFPSVPRLQLLLQAHQTSPDPELLKIVTHSLTAMAEGGIRDHLAGGFHRYSTDRRWHVPHFEKMLYDQAQLLEIYSQTARLTGDPLFYQVAGEIADFVKTELTLPGGGFCSALDAETDAIEGAYYVWSEAQVRECLGADADVLMVAYGMTQPARFEHGFVLHTPRSLSTVAEERGETLEAFHEKLRRMREKLLVVRSKRERPLLDTKALTEWNALMIQALAESGQLPGRKDDLAAAEKAAEFILSEMMTDQKQLMRSWYEGNVSYAAYLDDYASLASALIRLYEATGHSRWLNAADELTHQQIVRFYDKDLRTFFYTAHDQEKLIARTSTVYDSTVPSGNSVTVRNLLMLEQHRADGRLAALAVGDDRPDYPEIAESTLNRFGATLRSSPAACAGLACALNDWLTKPAAKAAVRQSKRPDSPFTGFTAAASRPLSHGEFLLTTVDELSPKTANVKPDDATTGEPAEGESHTVFRPVLPDPSVPGAQGAEAKDRPVKVKIYPYFDKLERGGKCPIAVEITIDKEWHINANPSMPDFLMPTELKVTSKHKVKMTKVSYPKHELLNVQGFDEPYHVYSDKVIIYCQLEVDAAEAAEAAELEIRLNYQACNQSTCMPPDGLALKGKLPLARAGEEIRKINQEKFPKPMPAPSTESPGQS